MTGQDGLRDEIAAAVEKSWRHEITDAVLPMVQRHIDAVREQVAEQIAQAIEARRSTSPYAGFEALTIAANIARQHAKGDGDE